MVMRSRVSRQDEESLSGCHAREDFFIRYLIRSNCVAKSGAYSVDADWSCLVGKPIKWVRYNAQR